MSFVRANLAGETTEVVADPNPIVVETGIPGFSLTVPITTPTRQKLAAAALRFGCNSKENAESRSSQHPQ